MIIRDGTGRYSGRYAIHREGLGPIDAQSLRFNSPEDFPNFIENSRIDSNRPRIGEGGSFSECYHCGDFHIVIRLWISSSEKFQLVFERVPDITTQRERSVFSRTNKSAIGNDHVRDGEFSCGKVPMVFHVSELVEAKKDFIPSSVRVEHEHSLDDCLICVPPNVVSGIADEKPVVSGFIQIIPERKFGIFRAGTNQNDRGGIDAIVETCSKSVDKVKCVQSNFGRDRLSDPDFMDVLASLRVEVREKFIRVACNKRIDQLFSGYEVLVRPTM